ncbi:MAG: DinB family protein [Paludibaculum sp.]
MHAQESAQPVETWNIHNRIHAFLLDALDAGSMASIPQPKGRSVAAQFAHIHNVRKMWLAQAAPDLDAPLQKLEGADYGAEDLKLHLSASGEAIAALLARAFEQGKVKGFKPHPTAFLGYLISHESHHRGQILQTLKQNGKLPPKKVLFGLWEWGVR